MARWTPARADVIGDYARELQGVLPAGRVLVGVGCLDPDAREAFATDLAGALDALGTPSLALSLDDFAGETTGTDPDADLRDAYDVAAFRRVVLGPYRRGEAFAVHSSTANGWTTHGFDPGERAAVVVSGAFVHRADLAGIWHTSAWLALPWSVGRERAAARLGVGVDEPSVAAESAAVDRYFQHTDPRRIANAVFDVTDAAHPRRVFADAC